ncbi:hypothetical protein NY08_1102 [Rhodococcus sp. B7740]|nr:hypothetical protein NY08_1102 [Rhodococcus sp. B7740]
MRQCSNNTDAWRDGSAYRANGRRIDRSTSGRVRCVGDYDDAWPGRDPDAVEPD